MKAAWLRACFPIYLNKCYTGRPSGITFKKACLAILLHVLVFTLLHLQESSAK